MIARLRPTAHSMSTSNTAVREAPRPAVHDVRDLRETVREEIVERRESGHDVDGVAPSAEAIAAASDDELERYLDALASAPRAAGWPYDEPSGLPAIEAAQPPAGARRALAPGG